MTQSLQEKTRLLLCLSTWKVYEKRSQKRLDVLDIPGGADQFAPDFIKDIGALF